MGRSRKCGEIIAGNCQGCGQHARLIVSAIEPGYCPECYRHHYKKSYYVKRQHDPLKKRWTAAEDRLVRQHFGHTPPAVLEALLPGRTWIGIQHRAYGMGQSRRPDDAPFDGGDICRPKTYWQAWARSTETAPTHPAMAELLRFLGQIKNQLAACTCTGEQPCSPSHVAA